MIKETIASHLTKDTLHQERAEKKLREGNMKKHHKFKVAVHAVQNIHMMQRSP